MKTADNKCVVINSNMRCIEIVVHTTDMQVLFLINSNMRCIEMIHDYRMDLQEKINSNMRCIEICASVPGRGQVYG